MSQALHGTPPTAALEQFLHNSYDVVQAVHRDLDAIRAVASHLTPVEDLVEFQNEVAALYAKLGVLVYASELLVQATPAGIDLLLAEDAPAQRVLLGLKSAALRDDTYFATRQDFDALSSSVVQMGDQITGILTDLATKVDHDELAAALLPLAEAIEDLQSGVGSGYEAINVRITELISQLENGDFESTALASALSLLETRVEETESGLLAQSQSLQALGAEISDLENEVAGNASAVQGLAIRVETTEAGIVSLSEQQVVLASDVTDLATGQEAQGTAIQNLSSRTESIEGTLVSQSEALTTLEAGLGDALTQTGANATAIDGLVVRVESTEAGQLSLANSVDQLSGQVTDLETGLVAQGEALSELEVRVESTEDALTVAAEERTALRASLGSTGNFLANPGFEVDLRDWILFSRGDGWLDAQLERDMAPAAGQGALPASMHSLGLQQDGVPAGQAGIRSRRIPVEDLESYILSGYLAAVNCTLRLEWRLFDGTGAEIGMGLAGEVTDTLPSDRLSEWTRVHAEVPIDMDGAQLEVQLWVVDCLNGFPQAWLLRPMLERKLGEQNQPSPWMDGVGGIEETFATAVQTLTTEITQTQDAVDVLAQAITDLDANLGVVKHWRVAHHAGSGTAASVGAALAPGLYPVLPGGLVDDPEHSFGRGLTLLNFGLDGALASAQRFDVYASATERNNLRLALNALAPGQPFVLVSQDHHGVKDEDLTAALENAGALRYENVPGSRPYLLKSRGHVGRGHGIEVTVPNAQDWQDHYMSVINDTPTGLGDQSGLADGLVAQAQATDALTVRVTENEAGIEAVSQSQTALEGRLTVAESGLEAQGTAVSDLTVRVGATEDGVSTLTQAQTALESELSTTQGDLEATSNALDQLTTEVSEIDGVLQSVATRTGVLEAEISDPETGLIGLASRIESEEQVRTSEDEALALAISLLSAGAGTQFDSAKIWYFDADLESWTGNGAPTIYDGWLRPADHASDPYVRSPHSLDVEGQAYRYVKLRIKKVGEPVWLGRLQWITDTDYTYDAIKQAEIVEPSYDENGVAIVDWEDLAWWPATVLQLTLRLSQAQTETDYFLIDWVAIGRPTPGAGVALVQEERTARIAGDVAEAGLRSSLAAQVRGGYTGDNIDGLTSGLLFEERTARVAADSALVQDVTSLSSRLDDAEYDISVTSGIVQTLTTEVENIEGTLAAQATDISDLTAEVADKAEADAVDQLTVRVTDAEGAITANSTALTELTAVIPDAPDNLIRKSTFDDELTGSWDGSPTTQAVSNLPVGTHAMRLESHSYETMWTPAKEGDVFEFSGWVNTASRTGGGRLDLIVHAVDKDTNHITFADSAFHDNGTAGWSFISGLTTAMPAGVAWIRPLININGGGGYSLVAGLRLARVSAGVLANASAISSMDARVSDVEGTSSSQATQLIELTSRMDGAEGVNAGQATAISGLTTRMTTVEGVSSANSSSIDSLVAEVGSNSASITTLSQVTASARVVTILNPSFELPTADSWDLASNMSRATHPTMARTGTGYLNVTAGGTAYAINKGRFRVEQGQQIRIWGWFNWLTAQPTNGLVRGGVRYYNEAGEFLTSTLSSTVPVASLTTTPTRYTGISTVPAGAAYAAVQVLTTFTTPSNARVMVDDVGAEFVTDGEAQFLASHSMTLDVNGLITGWVFNNDGSTGAFDVRADRFSVTSPSGNSGLSWTNGALWNRRGAYSLITSDTLGENMLFYIGPTPTSPATAKRANALFYVDSNGTGYFAGQVLQGVIRTFKSSTAVGHVAVVADPTSSNGKEVALKAVINRQSFQQYNGANASITPGGGFTRVRVQIQRRYGTGLYYIIADQYVVGSMEWFSEPGAGGWVNWRISGEVLATDVADPSERQYRVVLSELTLQNHTVTNPGTTPAAVHNQYTSIESME